MIGSALAGPALGLRPGCSLALAVVGALGSALAGALGFTLARERRRRRVRREALLRVCHELRGPLTAVRLGLDLGARTGGLPRGRLQALLTEVGRAALAVEDLTRVAAGGRTPAPAPRRLERVVLSELLDDAVGAAQGIAAARSATVAGGWEGVEGIVWGDRLRLAQAVGNLVANATEHGGGAVRVRGRLRGGRAVVSVDDDGPGLPSSVAVLARRPRGGRGRGLAIALGIAHAHGGTVGAAPVGRGGRVVLELPAAAAATRAEL